MTGWKRGIWNCIVWLLPGMTAGMILAAVLSYHEYWTVAGIAEFAVRAEPISGSDSSSDIFAQSLKESGRKGTVPKDGAAFLSSYGYRPMQNWGAYLPCTASVSILFFQLAGWITYGEWMQKDRQMKKRILELTEYLRSVNSGEGVVLCRNEDAFSHLEDEMYKTVMELQTTKESAVKNHEVLAERISDIAHQLKTPLTSMSLMTELLEEYQTTETEEYYSRLSGQIERLKNLVSGLLSLAKLDSHGIVFDRERILVPELVEAVSEPFREMLSKRRITLDIEIFEDSMDAKEEECFIYADRQWTEEALMNILKNCVEHTPDDGRIRVSYGRNPIYLEMRIEDGGGGFAPKDLPHIFERFYRGEGASKDNAGIGLALAKAVLEEQNGYLYAENTADGHACFRMKWYTYG